MTASRFIAQSETHPSMSSVPLESLKRFLKLNQWQLKSDRIGNLLVYEGPLDDIGNPILLTLPITAEFEDTPRLIFKVLNALSIINQTSIQAVCEEINNLSCDFLRQRIITSSNAFSIPLKIANQLLFVLSDLIEYSACLELDPQPFYGRRRKVGKAFTERCHFGQTFMGSFGISIQMPIPPSWNNSSEQEPFERRVMVRIARGLLSISKSLQEADVGILTQDYRQGFNANLFETMLEMAKILENHNMEFQFAWSSEFSPPADVKAVTRLSFCPEVIGPLLESAGKSLRSSSESKDTVIEGQITQLRIDEAAGDEDILEIGTADSSRRIVSVAWELESSKIVNIRIPLSTDDYKKACNAHRDDKKISVRGRPEKPGKYYYLASPSEFRVLE